MKGSAVKWMRRDLPEILSNANVRTYNDAKRLHVQLPYRLEVLVDKGIIDENICDRVIQMTSSTDHEMRALGELQIQSFWEKYYKAQENE